jgi:cation diffusion facilitator family transporter
MPQPHEALRRNVERPSRRTGAAERREPDRQAFLRLSLSPRSEQNWAVATAGVRRSAFQPGDRVGAPRAAAPQVPSSRTAESDRLRLRAGTISLVVSVVLLGAKSVAYQLTGSTAVLSDALESIVNVIAAAFALGGLFVARWPADRSHPYGHGKIEFFSAVFEGGLITFAALLILYQATRALVLGVEIRALNLGMLITLAAGLVNAALGWFLIRTGRQHQSLALVADGRHVLSDFWTSAGVVASLGVVSLTGRAWIDPLAAIVLGGYLGWTGYGLVREAAGGLLDEEDLRLIQRLVAAINANAVPGAIRVHFLRAIRSGRFTHVDAHLVVPEFWTVEYAHDFGDAFERRVIEALPADGEIVFHVDPCQRLYCSLCNVEDCPIRVAPMTSRPPLTVEEAVRPDMPRR